MSPTPPRESADRRTRKLLRQMEKLQQRYDGASGGDKRALLEALGERRLPAARDVLRFHEILCFLRAYPDDRRLLAVVERLLADFEARRDLRRHRRELADTGIAGTGIIYPFHGATAPWLARRWGDRLHIHWPDFGRQPRLRRMLFLFAPYCETPLPDEMGRTVRQWVDELRGADETDGAFLVRSFNALRGDPDLVAWLYDEIELPLCIAPGPNTPTRTRAKARGFPVFEQTQPLERARPRLRQAARREPLGVHPVSAARARHLIDLAREAMVTRARHLDVFADASPHDVRLVDWGNGLQFACIGAVPRRRFLLEAVYGFLTLKNGVPIGYVLASALFGSSEIAYNVFDTYRGAEAAVTYGKALATARHLLGSEAFTIEPYQLGHDNEEGLYSGAWWFYRKLGFQPLDPRTVRLMEREERRMTARPDYRSSVTTLRELVRQPMFLQLGRFRRDVVGVLPLQNVGLAVTRYLAGRFGSDGRAARLHCSREAAAKLGVRSLRGFSPGERHAWERWSPLVLILPRLSEWGVADRRALADLIRAKGGRRESDFAFQFNAHRPLRTAIRRLTT